MGAGRADVMLDCRWLAFWGVGRVSRLLLRGLAEEPPPGRWVLWGGRAVLPLAWDEAEVVLDHGEPRALFGQRTFFDVPPSRLAVFLHHQRPLRPMPALTMVYDTIALRYGGTTAERLARRAYLRAAARLSQRVITISRYSADCIRRDLGVPDDRIVVIPLPIDREAAARVAERRRSSPPGDFGLYLGRFAPHKNLDRLVVAFERTRFRAEGGRLVLAGGSPAEAVELRSRLTPSQGQFVAVRTWCEQTEVEELMATARFLVQPSLEEGFGLPVLEAAACGLPVCVSDGGALPETTRGALQPFPATSVEDMAAALDRCEAEAGDRAAQARVAEQLLRDVPTEGEYARRFRRVVEENLVP
jgi:glycosyltransferase involved in cell wall biosynthesis